MSHLPDDRSLALAPLLRRSGSVIESQIRGSSMAGALSDGTRIRIRCGSSEVYPTGTVIAFIIPGGLVGHRVVAVSHGRGGEGLLFTRGDRTVVADGPVRTDQVLGEVTEWFDGGTWRALPLAEMMRPGRRLWAALILAIIRVTAALNVRLAGRISGVLLRIAHRRRVAPGST